MRIPATVSRMSTPPPYRPASFRGVRFYLNVAAAQIGRRTIVHTYPQRDKPYAEDNGRKERGFTIEGCLMGADVDAQRVALEAALQTKGPGTLVLPGRGEQRVSVEDAVVSEKVDERGRISLKLTFVESGEESAPDATTDTQNQISQAVDGAYVCVADSFVTGFTADQLPDYALEEISAAIGYVLTTVDGIQQTLLTDYDAYADFVASVDTFAAGIASEIRQPAELAASLIAFVQSIGSQIYPSVSVLAPQPYGAAPSPSTTATDDHTAPSWAITASPGMQAFNTMSTLWTYDGAPAAAPWPSTLVVTPTRQSQWDAEQAIIDLVRGTAILEAAQAVAAIPFESYDQSQQVHQSFFDGISDYMADVDDAQYFALKAVRAAVTDDVTARGATLARIRRVMLAQTEPALATSYRLYGTPDNADDIVSRNNVAHPLQVPGGVQLEVLSNV